MKTIGLLTFGIENDVNNKGAMEIRRFTCAQVVCPIYIDTMPAGSDTYAITLYASWSCASQLGYIVPIHNLDICILITNFIPLWNPVFYFIYLLQISY